MITLFKNNYSRMCKWVFILSYKLEIKLIASGLSCPIWNFLLNNFKHETQGCSFVKATHLPCTCTSLTNNCVRAQSTFLHKISRIRIKNCNQIKQRSQEHFGFYLFKRCTRTNYALNFYVLRAGYLKYTTARN